MSQKINIHWFRADLRLSDNPALYAAAKEGALLPIFILDDVNSGNQRHGAASRWWLHHSLARLNEDLHGGLNMFCGDPVAILSKLCTEHPVASVYWNRCYEPWRITRDTAIKERLLTLGVEARSFNGSLLWEPWQIAKSDGTPYRVFTPYYRKGCLQAAEPREPHGAPRNVNFAKPVSASLPLDALKLLPKHPWDEKLMPHWHIGENAAQQKLHHFIDEQINHYKRGRDYPAMQANSRLSPHLHFGEVSPNQVWHAARSVQSSDDQVHFLSELGWREFAHALLYHFPGFPHKNFQPKFDSFPWQDDEQLLSLWQKGQTGFPLVDAGMRELWQTGYMHNRIRMVVGSFLVKNLLIDWRHGARWFWDCLVDADLANNSAGWQWIAGCGADAAPYFRVFNPTTQGEKFDPQGEYTRYWVPELANIPDKYLYRPAQASDEILKSAGLRIGKDYPDPIVDLSASRQAALAAYRQIANQSNSSAN